MLGQSRRGGRNECPKAFLPHPPPFPFPSPPFLQDLFQGKVGKDFFPGKVSFPPPSPSSFLTRWRKKGIKSFFSFLLPPSSEAPKRIEKKGEKKQRRRNPHSFFLCSVISPSPHSLYVAFEFGKAAADFAPPPQREIPLERGENSRHPPIALKIPRGEKQVFGQKKFRGLGMPSRSYSSQHIMPTGCERRIDFNCCLRQGKQYQTVTSSYSVLESGGKKPVVDKSACLPLSPPPPTL